MSDVQSERAEEGKSVRWTHEVTQEDVDGFAHLSGDVNPLHLDDAFARRQGFRGRVAHGMLLGAFLSRVLGTVFPGPGVLWLSQTMRFLQPVYIGDQIEIVVRVVHRSELLRTLVLETTVLNQRGETVLTGEARVMTGEQGTTVPWNEMVAVVTGASRGIGAAIALALGSRGASVAVNYHERQEAAREVVSAIEAAGGHATAVQADVSTTQGTEALADAALQAFGRVDVVVNSATPPIRRKPLLDLTWEEMDYYWRTYVGSTFTLARRVVPGMKQRKFGRFVHILTSYLWGTPPPEMSAYLSTKAALWGMTRSMAVELAPHGITVNGVSPSPVMTDQWAEVPGSRRRALSLRVPVGRLCTTEDVAEAVLYLVGNGGAFITGANLPIAGGEVM